VEVKDSAPVETATAEADAPAKQEGGVEEAGEPKAEDAKAEDAKAEDAKAEDATGEDATAEDATGEEPKAEDAKAGEPTGEEAKPEEEISSPRKLPEDKKGAVNVKGVDDFYPEGYRAKELPDTEISRRNCAFHGVFGMPSMKRYNIHFLSADEIIFVTGNKYQTYNITTQKFVTFHGKDRDGVGSIAVSPSKRHFAVAEKGD
jgi:hypothetical protein